MLEPVFIIGCPRSGTSITLDIMARHESFAWVSNLVNRFPNHTTLSRLNRIYDCPYVGPRLYLERTQNRKSRISRITRALPRPVEPCPFFSSYLQNFFWDPRVEMSPRRQSASDITPEESCAINHAVRSICKAQSKSEFLAKYTDLPRIKYLTQAFPHAKFVHVVRDGRGVARSYLEKIKKGEFRTWEHRDWWASGWTRDRRLLFKEKYNNPLAFVAFQWMFFIDQIREDACDLDKSRYCEVKYADIVTRPQETFGRIFGFCGLEKSKRVDGHLKQIALTNMDQKWAKTFSDAEKSVLEDILSDSNFSEFLTEPVSPRAAA